MELIDKNNITLLFKLARKSIEYYFKTGQQLSVNESEVTEPLKEKRGVFVTLEKEGKLRGCVGYIEPIKPLYQGVIENAVAAGFYDDRFLPLSLNELGNIIVEISILSAPQGLKDVSKLRPGIDGVILKQGNKGSTYLPQVWHGFSSTDEFLSSLCLKGGWYADCWQSDKIKIYTYQAEVFRESHKK